MKDIELASDPDGSRQSPKASSPGCHGEPPKWECFQDPAYYDMWSVRRVGATEFGQGFHLANGIDARALTLHLNHLQRLLDERDAGNAELRQIITDTPVLVIDAEIAAMRGENEAVTYARAIREWHKRAKPHCLAYGAPSVRDRSAGGDETR